MMDNLVQQLRSLARSEHDDLTIGDTAADEIEQLKQQLADTQEKCNVFADKTIAMRQQLAECERERDELKQWLEDQVCESKDFAYRLENKTVELAAVTAERDKLWEHRESLLIDLAASLTREDELVVVLKELMKYTPRTHRIGGVENGYDVPAGAAICAVLDMCDAALAKLGADKTAPEGHNAEAQARPEAGVVGLIGAGWQAHCWAFRHPRKEKTMFDPDDYELHEAQKHACKMAKERDEARVMADRLTEELAKCAAVLPGTYYMDPPDGGDVPVSEQLRRMAKDAERYRYLRRKVAIAGAQFLVMNLPSPVYVAPDAAAEFDAALDAESRARQTTRPPTPTGWSDTDWIRHLQEQKEAHPLAGQHINQGSMDAAADAYEAEYNAARMLEALKAAAQFVETEHFPIGWSVDRIREVIANVSGMTPNA